MLNVFRFSPVGSALLVGVISTQMLMAAPEAVPRLGTNLEGPTDWNTELPFVDVFRLSRKWISQQTGKPWGQGPKLNLDAQGWVKSLEPDCFAETLILTVGGHCPAGVYTVLYEGEGKLVFRASYDLTVVEEGKGRILIELKPVPTGTEGSVFVQLRETDPDNHLRNIRILLPGTEETYQKDPFRKGFLDMWKNMAVLRFMDWMHTNNSPVVTWDQRPKVDDATWTGHGGIPIEVMVDLCNRQQVDPWFCIPHMADDEYVRNFARLVKEKVAPDRKIYLEYSNEVWNSQFQQTRWAGKMGQKEGLAKSPWEAAWLFYSKRSVEIFKIWEEVFGGTDRLVRVLSSQAGNAFVARQIVAHQDAFRHADVLAIAPYVSFNVPPAKMKGHTTPDASVVETWTVDQVMNYITDVSLPEAIGWIAANKKVADENGLMLIGYEGGQHAVGLFEATGNEKLTKLLHEANRSARMGEVYVKWLDAWAEEGGDVMVQFTSIGRWGKFGSWGLMEYYDSDPQQYPKFLSVMKWAEDNPGKPSAKRP